MFFYFYAKKLRRIY